MSKPKKKPAPAQPKPAPKPTNLHDRIAERYLFTMFQNGAQEK